MNVMVNPLDDDVVVPLVSCWRCFCRSRTGSPTPTKGSLHMRRGYSPQWWSSPYSRCADFRFSETPEAKMRKLLLVLAFHLRNAMFVIYLFIVHCSLMQATVASNKQRAIFPYLQ